MPRWLEHDDNDEKLMRKRWQDDVNDEEMMTKWWQNWQWRQNKDNDNEVMKNGDKMMKKLRE